MRNNELWEATMNVPTGKKGIEKKYKEWYTGENKEEILLQSGLRPKLEKSGKLKKVYARRRKGYIYQGYIVYLGGKSTDIGLIEIIKKPSELHWLCMLPDEVRYCIVNASLIHKIFQYDLNIARKQVYAQKGKTKIYIGRIVVNLFNNCDIMQDRSYEIHHCSLRSNNTIECLRDTKMKNHSKVYGAGRHTQSVYIHDDKKFENFFKEIEEDMHNFEVLRHYNLY